MFTGIEDHSIGLTYAAELTKNYRDANINPSKGEFFSRKAIEDLLKQEGCVGIRAYFGLKEEETKDSQLCLVVVGVKANMDDMLAEGDKIAENGKVCPPYCSADNALNSDV